MDHLFEHEGQSVPDPSAEATTSTETATRARNDAMDEDDEDTDALHAAYGVKGVDASSGADIEAKVGLYAVCFDMGLTFSYRVLNVRFAERHSKIPLWLTSMLRRVDMINLKNRQKRYATCTTSGSIVIILLQIKPLTEEEKKQKLEELRAKLAEKRAANAVKDAEENKANEAIRRKAGKDMNKIKEEMKAKEAIKAAEQARKGMSRS